MCFEDRPRNCTRLICWNGRTPEESSYRNVALGRYGADSHFPIIPYIMQRETESESLVYRNRPDKVSVAAILTNCDMHL